MIAHKTQHRKASSYHRLIKFGNFIKGIEYEGIMKSGRGPRSISKKQGQYQDLTSLARKLSTKMNWHVTGFQFWACEVVAFCRKFLVNC